MKTFFLFLGVMTMSLMNGRAGELSFKSGAEQASLVEIYTSEGCSSCPPAEAWMSGLKNSPDLWQTFVPVAFHVDYWDYLGWRDRWASPVFSARQRAYAASWRSDGVYTPGAVLNGREWGGWAGLKSVKSSGVKAGVLVVTLGETNRWEISFTPVAGSDKRFEAHAALLGCGLGSDVKGGENRGRHLVHDFTVLKLAGRALKTQDGVARGEMVLPAGEAQALAVWVTEAGQMTPLQAAGGWLQK